MKPLLLLACAFQMLRASPMASQHTGLVETGDGVHLNYNQSGPLGGQQMLFIPGWRQTAAEWRKQVDYFAAAGFRVTTYDMRGHGKSENPNFGYRVSRFAADVNDLLTQLCLTDLTIFAHSMGCSVTWALWDQFPDARNLINKLVLVDQSSVMVRDPHWTADQAAEVSAIFTPNGVYDLANDMGAQTPPLVRSMFTDTISESDYEWVLSENQKMSDENAATLLTDHSFKDWRDVLPRINVRTMVIAGEVSIFPAPGVDWVATQIPGAKHYTFSAEEKGSHFAFWENPDKFNSVVKDFVGIKCKEPSL